MINLDHTFYVVFANCGRLLAETVVSDRRELIDNIVRGELGFENIVAVTSFNVAEGWSIDCTDDVRADADAEKQRRQDLEDFPLSRFRERA